LWLFPPVVLGVTFDAVLIGNQAYRLPIIPTQWVPETATGQLWFSIGLFIVSFFGGSVIHLLGNIVGDAAAYKVQHQLRTEAYTAMQELSFGSFENQQTGELLSILNNDVNQLEEFLTGTIRSTGNTVFTIITVGCYMILLNWQLAIVGFLAPLTIGIFNFWYSRYVEPKHQQRRQEVGSINTYIENNLSGMHLLKVYNREPLEEKHVTEKSENYKDVSWRLARARIAFSQVTDWLMNIGYLLLILTGGYWILNGSPLFFSGQLAAGTLLAFMIYNNRFAYPFKQLPSIIDSYQEAKAAGGRVLALLDQPYSTPDQSTSTELSDVSGDVEFDQVEFTYPGTDEVALSNVSFEVQSGDFIGLVGPTGAGKSTLMKLLLRFYEADGGIIRVDGTEIHDITLRSVRSHIGYVGQEPFLFDQTIRENIAYSRPQAEEDEIEMAAKQAGAYDFITDLPNDFETQVGERGVKLSGGQRQRISIARAIINNPDILILDEATSHVDNETEVLIQNNLEELTENRTTFTIAHRLSTVRKADQIVVLEDGEIVEKGTHDELLQQNGMYSNLWSVQVGEFESLPDGFIDQVTS
jgi:ATP-binding cassette subfamily B protein